MQITRFVNNLITRELAGKQSAGSTAQKERDMTRNTRWFVMLLTLLAIFYGTTSTAAAASKSERVLGLDDDVRVEATVLPNHMNSGNRVRIIYEIENRRPEPIAIYDIESVTSYDPETRMITVDLGAEVPVEQGEPILILSAEKRTFERTVTLSGIPPVFRKAVNFIRFRLHFLNNDRWEESMEPDSPEPAFLRWVEHKRTVHTNSIPIY
jgi:hypothetical protein